MRTALSTASDSKYAACCSSNSLLRSAASRSRSSCVMDISNARCISSSSAMRASTSSMSRNCSAILSILRCCFRRSLRPPCGGATAIT